MNESEKPQQPDLIKKERAVVNNIDLPPQAKMGGEFESPEKQYEYLQNELTRKYLDLEAQFESDIEDLNKKIASLRKRQMQLQQLSSLLDDPKEGWRYKNGKEQIDKKIAELETALAGISPKKVGVIGFRKKVENTEKTTPIKQQIEQERSRLLGLDKEVEEEADLNKKRLPILALELNIEEPVTKDKISMAVLLIKTEVDGLTKHQEQIKEKFISQRDNWPIVGFAPDGQTPQVKQVEVKDKEPGMAFEMIASGGNAFSSRTHIGHWPNIPEGTLWDYYGVSDKTITFGVGQKEGKRYIIFRQRQNVQNRGGYPYTALLDPGEEVRQKADYNDAVIIRNILADPVLKNYILNEPEKVFGMRTILLSRIEQSYLRTAPVEDVALQSFIQDTGTEEAPAMFDQSSMTEPTPEKLAQAVATLPEEQRRKFTFLIRGANVHGKYFGASSVWDAGR